MSLRLFMLPLQKINKSLPSKGRIYDIGCGGGDICYFLASISPQRIFVGIDMNDKKIKKAKEKNKTSNIYFICADVLKYHFKKCSGVIFSDFLHHLSFFDQEKLLEKISKKIERKGVLVVKEIDRDEKTRSYLSRLWDFVLYPHDRIYYRSKNEWKKLLEKLQFRVKTTAEVRWFPGSTTLFVCIKR